MLSPFLISKILLLDLLPGKIREPSLSYKGLLNRRGTIDSCHLKEFFFYQLQCEYLHVVIRFIIINDFSRNFLVFS